MKITHIIKRFDFTDAKRSLITLGPSTRLFENRILLKVDDATGKFPTDPDLFVNSWVANPLSLKRWTGFMVDVKHGKLNGNEVTTTLFRLSDGTQELYYNDGAAAWVPAGAGNWNTEIEVATNIDKFPAVAKKIQVIVNLATSNADFSPEIASIRLLYESDFEGLEDYIWRSLIPDMRTKIKPVADHHIASDGTSSIDLANDFKIETPYNILSVDSVYNLTIDPGKVADIFDSYVPGPNQTPGVVTLSSSPAPGDTVLIRFLYVPEIAVTTSQDYTEIEKVPQIVFEDITQDRSMETVGRDFVINKGTGAGKAVKATQNDIVLLCRWITDKSKDHARLADAIKKYLGNNQLLTSVGLDEQFRLWLVDEYDQRTFPSQQEMHAGRLRFRIVQALFYDSDAVDVHGTLNFGLTLKRNTAP